MAQHVICRSLPSGRGGRGGGGISYAMGGRGGRPPPPKAMLDPGLMLDPDHVNTCKQQEQ